MASVAIVLLSYGRADDTIECIRTLNASSFTDHEIIVVDNASPDGAADRITLACPGITMLRNDRNLGFAEGNNIGIRAAIEHQSRMVLVLNNDTVVEPTMLERLVAAAEARPAIGAVGPKIFYADAPRTLWYAGGSLDPTAAETSHRGIGLRDTGDYDTPAPCTFISGCAMLVPTHVWQTVGLFDAAFFAYLEDADFCHRVRTSGFELWFEPSAVVNHKVSSTTTWDSPRYTYLNVRNKLLFLRKHCLPWMWLRGVHKTGYYILRQLVRSIAIKRTRRALQAVLYGIADGLSSTASRSGKGRLDALIPDGLPPEKP